MTMAVYSCPDSKIHGANMGPTWGRQDPGGAHVGHTNRAVWVALAKNIIYYVCGDRLPENEIQWRTLFKSNAMVCLDDIVLV